MTSVFLETSAGFIPNTEKPPRRPGYAQFPTNVTGTGTELFIRKQAANFT